ncbi:sulfatase [Synoicihabitans lomoniglobus]|uniref:Sulfatase n=1 Tax=Synoicihabitans lomoniglobus TaxID=2909285 RepID=A0AAE9ZQE3_9BACT|nr:sulfatase [Opitutaceae bacterium LMO-M01]WED63150.1 sulfatase [Opitutaceae bacterium LMO-M01]
MIPRTSWLGLLGVAIAGIAAPPNVVFISIDDLNTDIGCYGSPQVKTPHIDRLAAMGVRFDRAYCQQPLCGPSRASVMSGLRPTTTGFVRLKDDLREKVPDVVTLGQFYRQRDYYVGRVGKIFHYGNPSDIGTDGHDDAASWMERFNPAGIDRTQEENIIRYPGGSTGRKNGLGISMAWWDPVSADEEHTDGMVAKQAVAMIDAHQNEPFFVAAGFFNPHCPYVAPQRYFDLYPLEEITMPDWETARRDLDDVPAMAVQRDTPHWPYYLDGVTWEEARKCKQAYYACISFVDAQVGKILDALEGRDLMDNTIIVLWSDHGYFLGEKGLWYKRKNFERSVRAPLIIAGAGIDQRGAVVTQPVELLDLYPTLADYTGHGVPDGLDGLSLRPLLETPTASWDKPAVTIVFHGPEAQGFSLRDRRWRYTEWMAGAAGLELYDHANDPDEITNLASDPAYASVIAELSVRLKPYAILQP